MLSAHTDISLQFFDELVLLLDFNLHTSVLLLELQHQEALDVVVLLARRRKTTCLQVSRLLLQLLRQVLDLFFFAAEVEVHLLSAGPKTYVFVLRYVKLDLQVSVHILDFVPVIFLIKDLCLVDFLQYVLLRRLLELVQ